jgi:hypothetical protein
LKFNNFTTIQKLILIWGICNYGLNLNILSEIPNIFTISKSLNYDSEEIFIYLDKTLDSLNVDLLASNFDTLILNVDNFHTKTDHYINNTEPPMLNSTHCNFAYNKILYDFVNNSDAKSMNFNLSESNCIFAQYIPSDSQLKERKNSTKSFKETFPHFNSNSNSNHINPQANSHYSSLGINLIYYCPVLKTPEIKKFMHKSLKENIKKICDLVNEMYNNNNANFYNYQTMTKSVKPHKKVASVMTSTVLNGNNNIQHVSSHIFTLNKSDLMHQLNNVNIDFSANDISKIVLEETKPTLSKEILEGVSFYSQNSINREWEYLRNPWYQNNIQFKPKFRKTSKNFLKMNFSDKITQQPSSYPTNISVTGGTNPNTMNFIRNLNDNRT